jgi:prepilin-type processing-associated H-X9-DG protein
MLWSLAVAAMLAVVADGAANAQQSGKRSGTRSGHTGGMNAAMGDGSVRLIQPGLGSGRRTGANPSKAYNPYVTVDYLNKAPAVGGARLQGGKAKARSNLKQLGLPSFGYENERK